MLRLDITHASLGLKPPSSPPVSNYSNPSILPRVTQMPDPLLPSILLVSAPSSP